MRKADNSKTARVNKKKEPVLKTSKSFSSGIMESNKIMLDETKMELTIGKSASAEVTPEEKHHLISEAAYYRSERRSFIPGHELDDWLNAESEIEGMLSNLLRTI